MSPKKQSSSSSVRIARLLPASPREVFAAWLDPDGIKRWLCPGSTETTVAELDTRVGGRFRIIMRDGGVDYVHTGEYREIDPPRRLVFTWVSELTNNQPSLVTLRLRKKGDKTELILIHQELPSKESGDKHKAGWGGVLEKLTHYLSD